MPIIDNAGLGHPLQNAGAPVAGTDEVQTITPDAVPASGFFKLVFQGQHTAALDFDATAQEVEDALNALATIGTSGVSVTKGGGPPEVWTVTFDGGNMQKLAVPLITVEANTVKDAGAAAVTLAVAEDTPGVTATGRGAPKGALLLDTTNGVLYINTGTSLAPTWTKVGTQA